MKKLYLGILSISLGIFVHGQSFIITTPSTATANLVTPLNTDVTGDTSIYYNASPVVDLVGKLYVINNTGSNKTIKVRRTILFAETGTVNQFCWGGLCYSPSTNVSTFTEVIAAGDTNKIGFYADYFPNGMAGITYVKYKFYNDNDTTEFSETTIRYASGTTGIEDEEIVLSKVYPNPAQEFISFDYNIGTNDAVITIAD